MGNDAACQMIGIGTIQIKMFHCVVRNLMDVRCSSDEEKYHLSWSCGVKRAQGDIGECNSQGHERVLGCDKGDQRQELVLLEE